MALRCALEQVLEQGARPPAGFRRDREIAEVAGPRAEPRNQVARELPVAFRDACVREVEPQLAAEERHRPRIREDRLLELRHRLEILLAKRSHDQRNRPGHLPPHAFLRLRRPHVERLDARPSRRQPGRGPAARSRGRGEDRAPTWPSWRHACAVLDGYARSSASRSRAAPEAGKAHRERLAEHALQLVPSTSTRSSGPTRGAASNATCRARRYGSSRRTRRGAPRAPAARAARGAQRRERQRGERRCAAQLGARRERERLGGRRPTRTPVNNRAQRWRRSSATRAARASPRRARAHQRRDAARVAQPHVFDTMGERRAALVRHQHPRRARSRLRSRVHHAPPAPA